MPGAKLIFGNSVVTKSQSPPVRKEMCDYLNMLKYVEHNKVKVTL